MNYQKDTVITVEIVDCASEGEGIGKIDGYPFFIKDALIGDVVKAKVMKAKKNFSYARLLEIVIPSKKRCNPPCPVYKSCGGCQLQAMSYPEQLLFKQNKVRNNLQRIGKVLPELLDQKMESIIGMEDPWRYRNKAQYPIGRTKKEPDRNGGKLVAGFYAGRTHSVIACEDCFLGPFNHKDILSVILGFMDQERIEPYDEKTRTGIVRHVLIREGFATGQIMVVLVMNEKIEKSEKLHDFTSLIDELRKIPGMASIILNENRNDTNVILGNRCLTIFGSDTIEDRLMGLKFQISPLAFYQVNPIQTEKLYKTVLEFADLSGTEEVWDICCGIGTITLALSEQARLVHGLEIVPEAIDDAKKNAQENQIQNVDFLCAPAEVYMPEHQNEITADVIVVDPPRKGMDEESLAAMVLMNPEKIVYVSCDSATLARDVKYLNDHGYELARIRPVDMFPHSVHVETVCLLSKLHEAKHHVSVKLDMDELDLTASESKATYEEIKKYVAEHYDGMKVTNLYIAQVMRKCGIELAENFNLPKWEGAKGLGDLCSERTGVGTKTAKQPQCPKEKEDAIVEALKHFKMI